MQVFCSCNMGMSVSTKGHGFFGIESHKPYSTITVLDRSCVRLYSIQFIDKNYIQFNLLTKTTCGASNTYSI